MNAILSARVSKTANYRHHEAYAVLRCHGVDFQHHMLSRHALVVDGDMFSVFPALGGCPSKQLLCAGLQPYALSSEEYVVFEEPHCGWRTGRKSGGNWSRWLSTHSAKISTQGFWEKGAMRRGYMSPRETLIRGVSARCAPSMNCNTSTPPSARLQTARATTRALSRGRQD